jgi:hypothetical protein
MPAVSEKQRKFFGAVMGAKKGKKGPSGKAKEVAKEMPEKEIKKFLKTKKSKKKEQSEESVKESALISNFIEAIVLENYSEADKYLKAVMESKLQQLISDELSTPLF